MLAQIELLTDAWRRVAPVTCLLAMVVTSVASSTSGAYGAEGLVIIQPGYPGSTKDAAPFVQRLVETISSEDVAFAWGEYHNEEKTGLELVRVRKPSLGIVSLGFYLKHREALKLQPLLWSRPDEAFRLVVRKDTLKKLDDLGGRSVTGTPFVEPQFVERILFSGAMGRPDWKVTPSKLFSRAVRHVAQKKQDSVLLSHREYLGFQRLRYAKDLEVIHTTRAYPTAVVVAFGDRLSEGTRKSVQASLQGLTRIEKGPELLEEMGIDGFAPVNGKRLGELQELHAKGSE